MSAAWLAPLSGFLTAVWQIAAVDAAQFYGGFSLWMTTGVFCGAFCGLAAGAAIVAHRDRNGRPLWPATVLLLAAVSIAAFPWLLAAGIEILLRLAIRHNAPMGPAHLLATALPAAITAVAPGMVFPLSWGERPHATPEAQNSPARVPDCAATPAASVLGHLACWNKFAAAAGALAFPWLLVPTLGGGGVLLLLSAIYVGAAWVGGESWSWRAERRHMEACHTGHRDAKDHRGKAGSAEGGRSEGGRIEGLPLEGRWVSRPCIATAVLCVLLATPFWQWLNRIGLTWVNHPLTPRWEGTLLDSRSGPYGRISVVEDASGSRRIFVGKRYALNGTNQALKHQRNQALIPWALATSPKRILHIGMASGITTGAFLQPSVRALHGVEIIPEVAEMARLHFVPWNNAVFDDARFRLHCDDGRTVVRQATVPFDLIVVDMLHPTRPSTRFVNTREFFALIRSRLSESGLFCLWLPAFQMDVPMWSAVARNFAAVFPGAAVVRANFSPQQPVLGLIGWKQPPPSLGAAWSQAAQRRPAMSWEPSLLFQHPGNFALALAGPLDCFLSSQNPHALTWDHPWFTLHAAAIRDKGPKLTGRSLLRWLQDGLARWQPTSPEDKTLHRAASAALRYSDALLPWGFPTASDEEFQAKSRYSEEHLSKAAELYPEAVWVFEAD